MKGKFIYLGSEYKVIMCDNTADVDINQRENLFGQVDVWTCTIRLYKQRPYRDLRKTWMHEVIGHLVLEDHLNSDRVQPTDHEIDVMVDVMYDTLERNGLLADDWSHVIPGEKDDE
jgi:hypothetical protein